MNTDVRIATSYPDHPKTLKLKKMLGADGVMSHIFLLCYVARVTPSGELKDMDAGDIAAVARWTGDPKQFVHTLVDLKLLDNRGDTYSIHNWQKHNYFAMTAPIRSEVARRNINKRWHKKNKVKQEVNTDGITDANTDSNTPSPSPKMEGRGNGRGSERDQPLEVTGLSPSTPIKDAFKEKTKPIWNITPELIDKFIARNGKQEFSDLAEYANTYKNKCTDEDLNNSLWHTLSYYESDGGLVTAKIYFRQELEERSGSLNAVAEAGG